MEGRGRMATVNLDHNAPEAGWAEGSSSHLVASSFAAVGVEQLGGGGNFVVFRMILIHVQEGKR